MLERNRRRKASHAVASAVVHVYMPLKDDEGTHTHELLPKKRGAGDYTHIVGSDGKIYVEVAQRNLTLPRGDLAGIVPDQVYWHPDAIHTPRIDADSPLLKHEHVAELWERLSQSGSPALKVTNVEELPPDEGFDRLTVENHGYKVYVNSKSQADTTLDGWFDAHDSSLTGAGTSDRSLTDADSSNSVTAVRNKHVYVYSKYQAAPTTLDGSGWIQPAANIGREDLQISDACWYDVLMSTYAKPINQQQAGGIGDHKRYKGFECTYPGLWRFFHPGQEYDRTNMGLSIEQVHKFFHTFSTELVVLDVKGHHDRRASYKPEKPTHKLPACWVMQHNGHIYPLTHGRKRLAQLLNTIPNSVLNERLPLLRLAEPDVPAPLTDHVYMRSEPLPTHFMPTLDDLPKLDLSGKDDCIRVAIPVHLPEVLRQFLERGYEPKVTMRSGEIISLTIRLEAPGHEPKDIIISAPDQPENEAAPMIADQATFELFRQHDMALNKALMNKTTLSTYSKTVGAAFRNHPRAPLVHGFGPEAVYGSVVAHDQNKAYTAMLMSISHLPVPNSFDEFEALSESLRKELAAGSTTNERVLYGSYQVERLPGAPKPAPLTPLWILLDKDTNIVGHKRLMKAQLQPGFHETFHITAAALPSKVVAVNVKQPIKDLYSSSLPLPLKKYLPNKTIGVATKRYNSRESTMTFQDSNEAFAYNEALKKQFDQQPLSTVHFHARHVEDRRIYFVNTSQRRELVDGFYQISAMVQDEMRVALAEKVEEVPLACVGVKTDCAYFQGDAVEVPKDHSFEGIGKWSVSVQACRVPMPRKEPAAEPAPIKPWVPAAPIVLPISDEWDLSEFAAHFDSHNRVLILATIPGAGKTHAAAEYIKGRRGVIATPYNSLCADHHLERGLNAITLHDLLGVRVTDNQDDENKKRYDLSEIDVVVIDEIGCCGTKMLERIRDLMDDNPRIKFIATGDPYQLTPIETLCMGDRERMAYNDRILTRLFPYQITLHACKRVKAGPERVAVEQFRDTIWDHRRPLAKKGVEPAYKYEIR